MVNPGKIVKKKRNKRGRKVPKGTRSKKPVDKRQDRNILQLYKMVRFGKEKKYIDQQLQTSISTTWSQLLPRDLTYIPEGTQDGQRIGNKVKLFRYQIKCIVTSADLTNIYRILVVRFGHCPTASLGIQNVLEDYNNTSPFQILGFFKRNAPSKYQILYDSGVQRLAGNYQTNTSPAGPISQRVHNIVLKNPDGWLAQYADANANSVTNGFTYVVAVTDSSVLPNVGFQTMSRAIFSG